MNDDEIIKGLRGLLADTCAPAADRFEALLAENAALRAGAGRVPVSWDECANWLEAGGVVWNKVDARPTICTADEFRSGLPLRFRARPKAYRLLPPPNLVAAPPGMDGGGFLGAGADVPEGWWWREAALEPFHDWAPPLRMFVQCRPPKPARKVVEVPLAQLVGRRIEGFEAAGIVRRYQYDEDGIVTWWAGDLSGTFALNADQTVRVYAEGHA